MIRSHGLGRVAWAIGAAMASLSTAAVGAAGREAPARVVEVDLATAGAPLDRTFDLSVGADFPATLGRADSLEQIGIAAKEPGFRYVHHSIEQRNTR